ncbi:MAG: Na+/H+ antiporter subunit E [Bacteroidales bacterium]|nr:Na+/H+ antiporter subunit E [Bacteroidales bacterium]
MKIKNQLAIFFVLIVIWILFNNSLELEILGVGFILSLSLAFIFGRRTDVLDEFKFSPKAFFYTGVYLLVFFWDLVK